MYFFKFDIVCVILLHRWLQKYQVPDNLKAYWKVRESLTVHKVLPLYNGKIVVSRTLQKETLRKIHEGHQGVGHYHMQVREWWLGLMFQMIQQCPECIKKIRQTKEPLFTTPLPDFPWQNLMVGTDLFELKKVHYLTFVDYFSRYPEVTKLSSTTSSAIIAALQAVFSHYGIPDFSSQSSQNLLTVPKNYWQHAYLNS